MGVCLWNNFKFLCQVHAKHLLYQIVGVQGMLCKLYISPVFIPLVQMKNNEHFKDIPNLLNTLTGSDNLEKVIVKFPTYCNIMYMLLLILRYTLHKSVEHAL